MTEPFFRPRNPWQPVTVVTDASSPATHFRYDHSKQLKMLLKKISPFASY
jgi:hypothetical protein